MIPISLTIKGLYSYQHEQTIDFRPLLEGQLFGIFGSVGSGKSSILEAITFALYGESDRLNQRDNRNYNMMNLKSKEMKIDFTFRDHDEKEYRFVVSGKRSGTQFDTVRTLQRKAYRRSHTEWIPMEVNTAEGIIGLSYDNFRRTMIIPQGKFQEFLQLGDKDRTNMMKELFNLDKFEFFHQTASLEKRNNDKISNLQGQLSHYEEVNEEILKEHIGKLSEINKQVKEHEERLTKKLEEEQAMTRLKELFEELAQKKKAYNGFLEQQEVFNKREEKLAQYQECERLFRGVLEKKIDTGRLLTDRKHKHTETTQRFNSYKAQLKNKQAEFEEIEKQYRNLDQKKAERDDYGRLVQLIDINTRMQQFGNRIQNGEKEVNKIMKQNEQIEHEQEYIDAKLENLKKELPDQNRLTKLKSWFTHKHSLDSGLRELNREKVSAENNLADIDTKLEKAIPGEIKQQTGLLVFSQPDKIVDILQELSASLEKKIESNENEIAHLQVRHKLDEFTDALQKGEPCPLCGSTEHPKILNVEAVDEQLKQAKEKQKQQKKALKQLTDTITVIKGIQTNKLYREQALDDLKKKRSEKEKQLEEHRKAFSWKEYDPEDDNTVDEHLNKTEQINTDIKHLESKRKKAEKYLKDTAKKTEQYKQGIQTLRNEKISLEGERKSILNSFISLEPGNTEMKKDEAGKKKAALEKEIDHIEKRFQILEREIKKLNDEKLRLETTLQHLSEEIDSQSKELKKINRQISDQLGQTIFKTLEKVEDVLKQKIDVDKERKTIEKFRRDMYAAQKDFESTREKIRDKSFDPEKHKQILHEVNDLKNQNQELKEKHITLKNKVEQLTKDLQAKEAMLEQLEHLRQRAENLATMKKLFKGSGFVNYISSVYLQNLCEDANERFYKLTRQQLQLEVDENNNFQVRDFLNNGRVRSVKTLSGGQTFQASLSLALALAGNVQQQSSADQNFFFLDEGFGTLDKASLLTVFDTLKSLRSENRIVGIISHVDELQQEIDMHIRITNHPEEGSLIKESWN